MRTTKNKIQSILTRTRMLGLPVLRITLFRRVTLSKACSGRLDAQGYLSLSGRPEYYFWSKNPWAMFFKKMECRKIMNHIRPKLPFELHTCITVWYGIVQNEYS